MNKKFIEHGLRFECQKQNCCCRSRGDYAYVYLSLEDRRRLAHGLRMSTSGFTRRYCEKVHGYVRLKNTSLDCTFLTIEGCSVYKHRPVQCRTWPFWPHNLNLRKWEQLKGYCPGIGKGRLYSKKEIEEQALQHQKNETGC